MSWRKRPSLSQGRCLIGSRMSVKEFCSLSRRRIRTREPKISCLKSSSDSNPRAIQETHPTRNPAGKMRIIRGRMLTKLAREQPSKNRTPLTKSQTHLTYLGVDLEVKDKSISRTLEPCHNLSSRTSDKKLIKPHSRSPKVRRFYRAVKRPPLLTRSNCSTIFNSIRSDSSHLKATLID